MRLKSGVNKFKILQTVTQADVRLSGDSPQCAAGTLACITHAAGFNWPLLRENGNAPVSLTTGE
jgi:hypothetical protein